MFKDRFGFKTRFKKRKLQERVFQMLGFQTPVDYFVLE